MSVLSRLRSWLQTLALTSDDQDPLDAIGESLASEEEEGFLLASPSRSSTDETAPPPDGVEASETSTLPADAEDEVPPPTADAAGTDEPAAKDSDAPSDLPAEPEEPEPAQVGERPSLTIVRASDDEEEAAPSPEPSSPGAEDDVLAALRSAVAESSYADLTKGLDDATAAELLAELREVRGLLPATSPEQNTEDA